MSVHTHKPETLRFKQNELDTLVFIYTRGIFAKYFKELGKAVEHYKHYYTGAFKRIAKGKVTPFNFHADFEMMIQDHEHRVVIGANLDNGDEVWSYSLGICGKDGKTKDDLIRKFHFDFADPQIKTEQPVPVYHLQYGGELSPRAAERKITTTNIESWLSVPRLVFAPVNLALLLDITFVELKSEDSQKILTNQSWRDLIYKNEKFLIKNYYGAIAQHVNSQRYDKHFLIRDFFYGK